MFLCVYVFSIVFVFFFISVYTCFIKCPVQVAYAINNKQRTDKRHDAAGNLDLPLLVTAQLVVYCNGSEMVSINAVALH